MIDKEFIRLNLCNDCLNQIIKRKIPNFLLILLLLIIYGCLQKDENNKLNLKISLVNAPSDIVTLGAIFLSENINQRGQDKIASKVYHSGVLSGGKGSAEIELCQQGSIEIHITTTAYLANLVRKTSIFSLPFLFRDINQVVGLAKSESLTLKEINKELHDKNLHVVAWWPRGFRQLTNSKRPIRNIEDIQGLKFRVMTNQLFVDNMNAMGAHPVPMDWGEVYNALQLKTIDGQENAEDVIFSSRLYEVQQYMTIWDYSTDYEVVMVNFNWWNGLDENFRSIIQEVANESVDYQVKLLEKNTMELRKKITQKKMQVYYMDLEDKLIFRNAVKPVWDKYIRLFGTEFTLSFLEELENY
jgi:tripartite ATP-independent transporter DctP family solute receptor